MKKKLNIAVLTVSDSRNSKTDKSGKLLEKKILNSHHNLFEKKICKDNKIEIKKILKTWLKKRNIDVIIATGGTGLTKRDITPEVFKSFFEKDIPGFGEIFRMLSYKKIKTSQYNRDPVLEFLMVNIYSHYPAHLLHVKMLGIKL